MNTLDDIQHFSDSEIEVNLKNFVSEERRIGVEILRYLREVERRKIYLARGFSSLFQYACTTLKYSEDQAHRRISAMREMATTPVIEKKLEHGDLTLSQVAMVRTHFREEEKKGKTPTPDERKAFFEKIEGKSSRETETLIREVAPEIRRPEFVRPIDESTVELRLNLSRESFASLQEIQDLASHTLGGERSLEKVFAYLIDRTKKDLRKEKYGEGIRSRTQAPDVDAASRVKPRETNENAAPSPAPTQVNRSATAEFRPFRQSVPKPIQREVFRRDDGKCQYRDPKTGALCGSTFLPEIDHVVPLAHGGTSLDAKNLRIYCDSHNRARNFIVTSKH